MSKLIKIRPARSDDELKQGASYVGYEWAVMAGARLVDWHKDVPEDKSFHAIVSHSARTELILLHARALYDFLFYPTPRDDDVISIDVLGVNNARTWEDNRGNNCQKLCPILNQNRDRIHKMLAHLSYDRKKLKEKDGPHPDVIERELIAAFKEFWSLMEPNYQNLFKGGLHEASSEHFPFIQELSEECC